MRSYNVVRSLDVLIMSGGGQLCDLWRHQPYNVLKFCILAKLSNTPLFIVGVGVGPLEYRSSKLFAKWAVRLASYASFRDVESQTLLRDLGTKKTTHVHPDPAYALDLQARREVRSPPPTSRLKVGLNPMGFCDPRLWPRRDVEAYTHYLDKLAVFSEWLLERDYELEIFTSDITIDQYAINDLRENLRSRCGPEGVDRISSVLALELKELLLQMAGFDVVVTPKFHGVIFSHLLAKPVIALSYQPKIDHLMRAVGQSMYCLDIEHFDVQSLIRAFGSLVHNKEEVASKLRDRSSAYATTLQKQFNSLFGVGQAVVSEEEGELGGAIGPPKWHPLMASVARIWCCRYERRPSSLGERPVQEECVACQSMRLAKNMSSETPLVSVVTPVYNGAKYLVECIESVLGQTYERWEYIIVNNFSTDDTLKIARRYADRDRRIKVVSNCRFVGGIENHNIAFSLIAPGSKYCKVVSADDWLYLECIQKLVEVAESHPAVGIVGSYAINAKGVRSIGLPYDKAVFAGREVCRLYLLGAIDPFGTPSTVLYRSAIVRSRDPFFPGVQPNADLAACLRCLETAEFAFVHQILSFERIHDEAVGATLLELNSFLVDRLQFLDEYGPMYLNAEEVEWRREELLGELYRHLAVGAINLKGKEFWAYHKRRLRQMGYPFYGTGMAKAVGTKIADLVSNPKQTFEKILRRRRNKMRVVNGVRRRNE